MLQGLFPIAATATSRPAPRRRSDHLLLFDRSNYRPERDEDEPAMPSPRRGQERVLLTLVFALLMLALVLPVSAAGLVDIVHYLFG